MKKSAKANFLSNKFKEIKTMGVRKNTKAPVSSSNPRRQVSTAQMQAIALSEARRKGYKV